MTVDQYLRGVLARQFVGSGDAAPALVAARALVPVVEAWGGQYLVAIQPSGSFAKGTAIRSGTDIDLFLSLSSSTPNTLGEIYQTLLNKLKEQGLNPTPQNVSLRVRSGSYDVDLVPAKRQNQQGEDHSLYRRKADTWTKTNVARHIRDISTSGRLDEIKIVKTWRNQQRLDFPSFYLELTVIAALKGKSYAALGDNVLAVFEYLTNSFPSARVVDPANSANIISDDLTAAEKSAIAGAARVARAQRTWEAIVT